MGGGKLRRAVCAAVLMVFASCGGVETDTTSNDSRINTSASRRHTIITDTTAACGACDDAATLVRTLRTSVESAQLLDLPDVEMSTRGTYYIGTREGAIYAYDTVARRLRLLARRGRGPGEIDRLVTFAVGAGDSVYAVSSDRRLLVYAPDRTFARGAPLEHGVSSASHVAPGIQPLPSGNVIMSAHVRTPALDGVPLFLMNSDGQLAQAFGTPSLTPLSAPYRLVARDQKTGALWVAESQWYRVERYESLADTFVRTPVRVLGVQSPWVFGGRRPIMTEAEGRAHFEKAKKVYVTSDVRSRPRVLEREPLTAMRSLRVSGDTVWVAWQVPAPNWNKVELTYPLADEMMISSDLNDSLWNTVVEVLDVRTNRVLLRKHFPFHAQLAAPGTLAHPYFDDVGNVRIDIWAIRP